MYNILSERKELEEKEFSNETVREPVSLTRLELQEESWEPTSYFWRENLETHRSLSTLLIARNKLIMILRSFGRTLKGYNLLELSTTHKEWEACKNTIEGI